jgi:NOL1/NOP2/fmu family ribosome biogenesis protein
VENATVFSCGITIGEIKKNYIQPHHQLFMGLGDKFKRKIELSPESDEIKKYLHGEEFFCNAPDGWAAILVGGCSVGGVKVTNGTAKNHYPKGLRTLY